MDSQIKIGIILASVREKRRGEAIAQWIQSLISVQSAVQVSLFDLKDWPFANYSNAETSGAAEKKYDEGTLEGRWKKSIAEQDGFIFVTPEYNHGYPGSLKNALDHIATPWNYKTLSFVSYGGVASGVRAVEQLRQVAVELRMISIRDELNLSLINLAVDEKGWPSEEVYAKRALFMIKELLWMTRTIKAGMIANPHS